MPDTAALSQFSDNLVYSAMAVYALAMVAYAAEAAGRSRRPQPQPVPALVEPAGTGRDAAPDRAATGGTSALQAVGRTAVSLTVLAVMLHLAAVVARGAAAGRAPWGNMYEFAVTGALAAGGAYLLFLPRQPVRDLGAWIVGVILLTLGLSTTVLYTPPGDLVPALNSYWLVIHVIAAIVAGGVFTVGAFAGALYLVRLREDRRGRGHPAHPGHPARGYAASLPSAAALDRVAHVAILFAFPVWTFAVIAGAIWAENSWGRYWGWDPKETWAFITWVLYAAYLHAQSTAGWRGRRATWLLLAGYTAFVFNFFGVNMWISGLHSYAGI